MFATQIRFRNINFLFFDLDNIMTKPRIGRHVWYGWTGYSVGKKNELF